jgi:RsbT co-antagonist protein rsbRD N-terminal domain
VEKVRSKLVTRMHDQSVLHQHLPQFIRANSEAIVEQWWQRVDQDPEISSIPVSNSERKEYVPLLLHVATSVAEGKELNPEHRTAYVQYGAIRQKQGYTAPLLIRELRLLQASVADCIQRNFNEIEMSYLVPDTIHFMGTIDVLLEASAHGFTQQANREKVSNRRRSRERELPEPKPGECNLM